MRLKLIAAAALIAVLTAVALFLANRPSVPDRAPDTAGPITRIEGGRILVEEYPQEQRGDKCWFALTAKTRVYRESDGSLSRVGQEALAPGQVVRAWADGPVMESYPCQGAAHTVVIRP